MKVKFNGMFQEIETGCVPCGRGRKSKNGFLRSKNIIMPSGMTRTFHAGEVVEVSETDGEFLLSWTETQSGMQRSIFTRID